MIDRARQAVVTHSLDRGIRALGQNLLALAQEVGIEADVVVQDQYGVVVRGECIAAQVFVGCLQGPGPPELAIAAQHVQACRWYQRLPTVDGVV